MDSTLESNLSIRPEPDTESHALELLFSTAEPTTSDDLASSSSDHNSTDNNQEYNLFRSTLNFEDIDPTAEFSEVSDENFYECDSSEDDDDYNDFHDDDNVEEFNFEQALGDWYHNSNVTREQMNNLLSILIRAGHDDLHRDIRSIVETPKKTIITPCSPGEYYHRGLQNALVNILKSRKLPSKIVIDINIDGLPISKSSKRTLWPIQGLIFGELTPFVIGVYHGFKKPSSIEDYLRPFINEYKNLRSEGFNFRENSYKVKLRCVICDSPARSFCSNTKQFNGYFGCSKCVVEGSWRKKVVFLEANLTLRTNESFRNRSQPEHHLGYSPFEELEIDMVDQFPIDYMHTALLGVTKMLIKLWINFKPRFSYNQTETLSENFLNLSKIDWNM
uniref:Transposase domain-containing protein n=1 Tax=Trichogramma kaykai TaxID=54128 RepID=A0ABD2XBM6_9HYME